MFPSEFPSETGPGSLGLVGRGQIERRPLEGHSMLRVSGEADSVLPERARPATGLAAGAVGASVIQTPDTRDLL
jgi:hypothetical protein